MATFISTSGDDTFHGISSNDRVTFSGNAAGYRIEVVNGFVQVVDIDADDGDTGTDTLTGMETLDFADKEFSIAGMLDASLQGETRINTHTALDQSTPAIAALADGGYVVTWQSYGQDIASTYGIYAQRYDALGNAVGGESRINTYTTSHQQDSAVAGLADGGYVISWQSFGQDGSGYGIYAQRFDADGNAVGIETRINTVTTSTQSSPAITALANGGYVITWYSLNQDGDDYGIYAQRYNADGDAAGIETRINTYTASSQQDPVITGLAGGGYVIAWHSELQDGSAYGVYAQRFDADGNAAGVETRVNTTTANFQIWPAITALTDGGYVVAWHSDGHDEGPSDGIYAQRYDASGNALGVETLINTHTADNQIDAAITALADGGYVVAWTSDAQDGSLQGIYAQRFDADGILVGSETRINTYTVGTQGRPDITALGDGGYVIAWNSINQDGSGYATYAQRFDASGRALVSGLEITGTANADILNGGVGSQTINGLGGNDILRGGSEQDTLIGGSGNDTYVLTSADKLVELDGGGTDTVQAGFSYTLGNHLENLTLTGPFASNGTGNALHNVITGNSGNNTLNGLGGNDTLDGAGGDDRMLGGSGSDTFHLKNAGDSLIEMAGGGNDTVLSYLSSHTLAANFENLTLVSAALDGTGNTLGNVLTGNTSANEFLGLGGNDTLSGLGGNDALSGGEGNDILMGGTGNDSLTGGSGADTFRFSTALNASTNRDTVTSYVLADDRIQLDNAIFAELSVGALAAANFRASANGNASDANDYILYETDTGRLYYDADGNGAGAKVQFALIGEVTHPALTAAEFTVI